MKIKICIIGILLILLAGAGYSSAQSLNVAVDKAMIKVGAPIRASATVKNDKEKEVEWVFVASLYSKDPRAPVPRDFVKRVKLEPGKQTQIPISLPTEGLVYEGEYQLICGLFDKANKPIAKSIQYIRLTGGMKRLDITLKACKDSGCKTPARMFVQGETVYISYIANVKTPRIEASLVLPDQSKTTLTLPATIVVKQAGDYQMNAVITKPGYQTVKKSFMFGVIEPSHKLNQPVQLKQIE
ncbi:MAG: hypothetical protein IMF11_22690 [Proteobacteria bacterium]|nr:hypothetical protein [Pseudomonadota bacterium]